MGLILQTAVITDVGLRRGNNEDCAYAGRRLLVVADGMGGLPAGELASEIAVDVLTVLDAPTDTVVDAPTDAALGATTETVLGAPTEADAPPAQATGVPDSAGAPAGPSAAPPGLGSSGHTAPQVEVHLPGDMPGEAGGPADADGDELVVALATGFDAASERIRVTAADDAVREGMGTTVTALLFGAGRVAVMHVGDSRGYLFREGVLTQFTRDDTYVQALVDRGVLTAEDARHHPQKSLVTQAMQGRPIQPARAVLPVRDGDVFLLCSDGLSDVVADAEIALVLGTEPDLHRCAEALVAAAKAAGAPDNVTVVLARAHAI